MDPMRSVVFELGGGLQANLETGGNVGNVGALIIRIGFWELLIMITV